ncbi:MULTISPECIES: tyrosine-protein phosphatase [Psychrilyobacter]|uniref:protein-tyrosine-phosphatase n=1 Tax=Psychrilyobacter piezotolerans TaxID=2293438 RepID=A0ABX9KHZ8_9FUSO|nr:MULTISPECIES: CpsB/CapC family capsule biosynthesis tyrosine phosphatase [Psychrilyobacter]MCS5420935.1 hypothetical protein [Psychrilyobacter sp. S5]NDI77658.1 exopolysaccharide biosynthesis protein [Psychrilyobacter piezotolerans]RDE62666.1 exopolysaccharide biosynthesis protein [Psychrilyobacter sp. S5]REI41596.1 exopolysaccharide biosynthesis protein [Psychrilyobacter piezotolerans]
MTDLHCHILPKIDDGARNISESIDMALAAKKLGYKKLCCTSHYRVGRYENQSYEGSFEELKKELKTRKIEIEILEGNELFLDFEGLEALRDGKVKTLGGSKYILVEEMPGMTVMALNSTLEMVRELGYKPILAHVERYLHIKIDELRKLKEEGCILQMNLKSLNNSLRERCRILLLKGLIDVVASDAHRIDRRNYDLMEEKMILDEIVGGENARILMKTNPDRILEDGKLMEVITDEKKESYRSSVVGTFLTELFNRFRS